MSKISSGFCLPPSTGEPRDISAYIRGFRPYWRILRNLDLPARGPRGSAVNRKRAKMIQDALHAEKVRREKRKRR
jgi:hypothetical protein